MVFFHGFHVIFHFIAVETDGARPWVVWWVFGGWSWKSIKLACKCTKVEHVARRVANQGGYNHFTGQNNWRAITCCSLSALLALHV